MSFIKPGTVSRDPGVFKIKASLNKSDNNTNPNVNHSDPNLRAHNQLYSRMIPGLSRPTHVLNNQSGPSGANPPRTTTSYLYSRDMNPNNHPLTPWSNTGNTPTTNRVGDNGKFLFTNPSTEQQHQRIRNMVFTQNNSYQERNVTNNLTVKNKTTTTTNNKTNLDFKPLLLNHGLTSLRQSRDMTKYNENLSKATGSGSRESATLEYNNDQANTKRTHAFGTIGLLAGGIKGLVIGRAIGGITNSVTSRNNDYNQVSTPTTNLT